VCLYQRDAVRLVAELAAAGYDIPQMIDITPPRDCPPEAP
jgi:hypothetical protein